MQRLIRDSTLAPAQTTSPAVTPPVSVSKGVEARRRIISVAEALFAKQGFDGTSMREIAAAASMQAASMYYHFPSKEELLWAVWEKSALELKQRLLESVQLLTDPWERMEAACIAHVSGLLDWRKSNQVQFVMPPWQYPDGIRDRVIAIRNEYEDIFVSLIADLPLSKRIDRRYLRLALIGALSWTLFWYRAEGDSPAVIAKQILKLLCHGIQDTARQSSSKLV